jgi:hypothetical protein
MSGLALMATNALVFAGSAAISNWNCQVGKVGVFLRCWTLGKGPERLIRFLYTTVSHFPCPQRFNHAPLHFGDAP